jgi:quercetin dioxygenase-like cupin family protein
VGLDYFFAGARERPVVAVVRKKDRRRFPEPPGSTNIAFHFECLDYPATERKMNAYYAEFDAPRRDGAHTHEHAGAEIIYVLKGRLAVAFGDEEHVLGDGDSMYFDSGRPHAYRRQGGSPCAAVVVTTA